MLIKIIGSILILAGSCGCGWYQAYREKRRIRALQELQQLLLLLYGDIEYAAGDLVGNLDRLSEKSCYFSEFFRQVRDRLEERSGQPLYQIWTSEVKNNLGHDILKREDLELLDEVGKELGGLDRHTQLKLLHIQGQRVEQQLQYAQENYQGRARLCHVLGVTVGIFTCVLLF